jgi:fucose 4-O-acetylase-like acetyltransferase
MTTWNTARKLAEQTPGGRNRYVDFLRAASILVVVFGHWLMAAPFLTDEGLFGFNLLSHTTWTHYLTWILQVMPVFFFVGGYANAAGWRAARREGTPYGAWLRARLRRLLLPVLPLLAVWTAGAIAILRFGVNPSLLGLASQAALVPVWFLATYVLIVMLTPITLRAWEGWGWWSFAVLAVFANLIDLVSIGAGVTEVGYLNYLFVWSAVHQLGYAWADDRLGGVRRRLAISGAGLALLVVLVAAGPYPVAMVGLDTAGITNSQPPKITLIALAAFQAGLLLGLEAPARRLLTRPTVWTATVALNGMIMTVYLWHMTAMVAVIGGLLLMDGFGLNIPVDTPGWWLTRPLWLIALIAATLPFLAVFGGYERPHPDRRPAPPAWRPVLAVAGVCAGLGLLARFGIADGDGLNGVALTLPFAAAVAGGIGGARWWERRSGYSGRRRREEMTPVSKPAR